MPGRWRNLATMSGTHDIVDQPELVDHRGTVDDHTVDSTVLARRDDGHEIDTDPRRLDIARVEHWLATDTYWAHGRAPGATRTAIANSVCFGVYRSDGPSAGEQVAFARIVTD